MSISPLGSSLSSAAAALQNQAHQSRVSLRSIARAAEATVAADAAASGATRANPPTSGWKVQTTTGASGRGGYGKGAQVNRSA
jgi:hypothetical protein